MKLKLVLLLIFFWGCSSTRLVNSYKDREATPLAPDKILVVGVTPNMEARRAFEYEFQKALRTNSIEVVPSLRYFPNDLLSRKLSLAEVTQLEQQLLEDNFNAVILARVISVESKENLLEYMANLEDAYESFKIDYFENQPIGQMAEETGKRKVFHTETGIYHISEDNGSNLIWRGRIDIVNPEKTKKSVKLYIGRLISTLKKEDIITLETKH